VSSTVGLLLSGSGVVLEPVGPDPGGEPALRVVAG
jgi:hypothetical protein